MIKIVAVGQYLTIELGYPNPDQPEQSVCGGIISSSLKDDNYKYDHPFNLMMDAIESLVLAHACAGIDVCSEAYIEGLETAIDACVNNT